MDKKAIWKDILTKKRFVIKIGTNSLLEESGDFDFVSIAKLIKGIKKLLENGKEVLLVSSGAISAGLKRMKRKEQTHDVVEQQVLAAIGNPMLMQKYIQMFGNTPVAQVLLTQHDLSSRSSYTHLRNAIEKMLEMGIVPIINENDVVSIDELAGTSDNPTTTEYNFSDNDVLSALLTGAVDGDVLVVLSDVDGLYTKHPNSPNAEFIEVVNKIDARIKGMGQTATRGGRGGMKTKILAAEIATKSGAYTIITSAKDVSVTDLLSGNMRSTIFTPEKTLSNKSIWLLYATNAAGKIIIDDGAIKAIKKGASLLLPGILEAIGDFVERDVIQLVSQAGNVVGKGITNYSSKVIRERIAQKREGVLPKRTFEVVTHENMEFIEQI
mgnify:CR=1 FL=1